MLVYVSGPMAGVGPPTYNYRAFEHATARLRELGYDVLNPGETAGGATHLPRKTYMHIDLSYVAASDAVALLPGWDNSRGAKLEVLVARALGKAIFRYSYEEGLGVPLRVTGVEIAVEPVAYGGGVTGLSPDMETYVMDRTRLANRYVEGDDV